MVLQSSDGNNLIDFGYTAIAAQLCLESLSNA